MSPFQQMTKNNGLKNIEWGSDVFQKKIEQTEEQQREQEERDHYEECLAIIKGM